MANTPVPVRLGLLELLIKTGTSQFVIPVYQRNYTWTAKKEVKQYLDDLTAVINNVYSNHFLGIMIYLSTQIDFSLSENSIIDGQQRLTTTFLILYAIKELLILSNKPENQLMANKLEDQYLCNKYVPENRKLKLKPLVADDDVYQHIVKGDFDSIKNTDSNVYQNYLYIKERLQKLIDNGISFDDILSALDRLYLVCVPLLNDDNPQKIFESINSTGAKLTASDLIRNYILMTIESDKQEEYYKNYWHKVEMLLLDDSKKLESFFRFYLAAKNKQLCNISAVYSTFKLFYETELNNGKTSEDLLIDIKKYAEYYNELYYADINTINSQIKNELIDYRRIGSDMPAPMFMEFLSLAKNNIINYTTLANLFKIVNTYLIRRALCSLDTSSITRIFPTVLNDTLCSCDETFSNIEISLMKHLVNSNKGKSSYMPDDKELFDHLCNDNMYVLRSQLRVVLDKIENFNNSAPANLKDLSIEHLMPQDGKMWYDKLGITEDEYIAQRNRLGNLTLVSKLDNSKAQNNIWNKKKELFLTTSHLKLNEELLKLSDWNLKEIDNRTKSLANRIIELFPYYSAPAHSLTRISIHLYSTNKSFSAKGYFYSENGAVEISEDSMIENYREPHDYHDNDELYEELLDNEYIQETPEGAIFIKPYTYYPKNENSTALSTTAGLILIGSRNGKEYWLDETNKPIKENPIFKQSKFNK